MTVYGISKFFLTDKQRGKKKSKKDKCYFVENVETHSKYSDAWKQPQNKQNRTWKMQIELTTSTVLVKNPSVIIQAISSILSTSIFKPAQTVYILLLL